MSCTPTTVPPARVRSGFSKHFQQILNVWGGKECTHVQITETLDEMGQVIDQSRSTSTIYGIISPASYNENYHPIGSLQQGDLTAFFKYSDDVIKSSQLTDSTIRKDHIIYEGNEYRVEQIQEIAYDVDDPVFARYLLRKVSP